MNAWEARLIAYAACTEEYIAILKTLDAAVEEGRSYLQVGELSEAATARLWYAGYRFSKAHGISTVPVAEPRQWCR